jgi:hypothetical protein
MALCWQPTVTSRPLFSSLVRDIGVILSELSSLYGFADPTHAAEDEVRLL